MKQYPAYPAYKTTGCDWFPEIPSHWGIDRAKWSISSCQNGVWGAEPDGDDDLVCIRVADFDRQSLRVSTEKLTMRSIAEKDRCNRLLKNGDLLLEKSGGGEQQLVGAVVEFNQKFPAVSSNFIARMVASDEMIPRFLVYLHSHLYSGRVNFRSIKQTTGIQNLDSQAYLDEKITYPPLEEQQVIARFLDFKTAQIDALIAKQKILLDKLTEKRTALISHAVTKGLDPSVPMKDSGVAWLKEIPIDWATKRLRFLTTMSGGMTPSTGNSKYWGGDIPWITPKDMKGETLSGSIDTLTDAALQETGITLHESGRVLIVVRGMILAHTFPVAINNVPSTVNQDMKALGTSLDYEYLALLLRGIQPLVLSVVEESAHGTKVLRTDIFKNIFLPLPPPEIQKVIVKQVTSLVTKLKFQKQHIESVIERLQEYRSALITNAVTGKIDVRGFQVPSASAAKAQIQEEFA
ncbi:MAG: restriction endonuclease subunit S [Burkholderiaceae bacterium]|nr:restriction endonuclease subunit S [Burkholderiaceae bacterium]